MEKDHSERRTYRKSPGRQYGYEYDPLRSQSGSTASKAGAPLVQRPDPRRTRQLLRQSIIASKRTSNEEESDMLDEQLWERQIPSTPSGPSRSKTTRRIPYTRRVTPYTELSEDMLPSQHHTHPSQRPASRSSRAERNRYAPSHLPLTRDLDEEELYAEEQPRYAASSARDPERYAEVAVADPWEEEEPEFEQDLYESPSRRMRRNLPGARPTRLIEQDYDEDPFDYLQRQRQYADEEFDEAYDPDRIYGENEELPPGLKVLKPQKKMSRRNLLLGAGAIAVGAGIVSAIEMAPQVVPNVGKSIHDTQDAFNRGVAQGAQDARKELILGLETIEDFSLAGAAGAAHLTRIAYDVFVSPIVTYGSEITADFLNGMLSAFKSARGVLQEINQDNVTLVAIQHVLENWVNQANTLPKQINAITQADLDGAQAYLLALQRKVEDEKKKLTETPTPTSNNKKSGTPGAQPNVTPQAQQSSGH